MTESNQKQPEIFIKQSFWSVINFVLMLFAVFSAANDDIYTVINHGKNYGINCTFYDKSIVLEETINH